MPMWLKTILLGCMPLTLALALQPTYYHYPAPQKGFQLQTPIAGRPLTAYRIPQALNHFQAQYQHQHQHQRQPQPNLAQFSSPALESVAFTMALTSQGYVFTAPQPATAVSARSSPSAVVAAAAVIGESSDRSLNVRLPLPLGTTPIRIGPLPLQAGASYSSLPRGVTSYGTLEPQRR